MNRVPKAFGIGSSPRRGAFLIPAIAGIFLFMKHWVYILYSEKLDRFYTGETSNFDIRMEFHSNSDSKKFTGKAKDWELFLKFEC